MKKQKHRSVGSFEWISNPREIAYHALCHFWKDGGFVSDFLDMWEKQAEPTTSDARLARALAYGSVQRALSLDAIARKCTEKGRLNLKAKERALLYIALYQLCYLDRIPDYAAVHEAVFLAKKHCHPSFCGFLNVLLRRVVTDKPSLPNDNSIESLSITHSYPPYLIEKLVHDYGINTTVELLQVGNTPAPVMYRARSGKSEDRAVLSHPLPVLLAKSGANLLHITQSSDYYVQNATPVALMVRLAEKVSAPKQILDLCCAPGGKLIAAHDLFPEASLYANDISDQKVSLIVENLKKYGISAQVSCGPGERYHHDARFDLILIDVPCSNTGVLNKRPEARWRVTPEHLAALKTLEMQLIENAASLLSQKGQIWLMTCSILSCENSELAREAAERFSLKIEREWTILPNAEGWDGGFGCALSKDAKD